MSPLIKNSLAVMLGLFIGSLVNMGLIMAGGNLVPAPAGADVTTMEGLKSSMHLFQPINFLFPFLAHALGTLAGAAVAAYVAASHNMKLAMSVGLLFMIGGIANVLMLPSPAWFTALDLLAAYLPMAWLGAKLATKSAP